MQARSIRSDFLFEGGSNNAFLTRKIVEASLCACQGLSVLLALLLEKVKRSGWTVNGKMLLQVKIG